MSLSLSFLLSFIHLFVLSFLFFSQKYEQIKHISSLSLVSLVSPSLNNSWNLWMGESGAFSISVTPHSQIFTQWHVTLAVHRSPGAIQIHFLNSTLIPARQWFKTLLIVKRHISPQVKCFWSSSYLYHFQMLFPPEHCWSYKVGAYLTQLTC